MTSLSISEWFTPLSTFEKIYWCIAIFFSLLFIIQNVMSFLGGDVDTPDATGDVDELLDTDTGIGFQFFTIRNMFGFFTIFGWTGLACIERNLSPFMTIMISTIAGTIMMVIMATLFYYTGKLVANGTMKIENALGATATVYLPVPGTRNGTGKVNLVIQGTLRELDALTDDSETLPTGAYVKVIQILNNQTLIVTKQ
ncbi:hypothetical protein COR50_16950 [Chitinophaga caeni]|uniref:Serine protease n=1 Tax=Chitinophaga caeni TaxID=2029983 RepID=A0A291QXX4_9BACT|nr:hypothetical protein [Chitinophaga caeni]ATL48714.1 hypothetical protein COR50_16950 [Chitinophaga caeni]